MSSKPAFHLKVLTDFRKWELINDLQYSRLKALTVEDLREMNGILSEDFAGPITPFINRRLDLMRQDSRDAVISAYLERTVKYWREQKKTEVPPKFNAAFLQLTDEQKFSFMATFYIDAFQTVHDSLFDELISEDVGPIEGGE